MIEKAPCNVVVFKNYQRQVSKRILVPLAGGPNSAFALEIASILVDPDDGEIVPFNVTQPGRETLDIEVFIEQTIAQWEVNGDLLKPKYEVSRDVTKAILDESEEYDLVVIGASKERLFQQMVMSSIPEEVARRCDKPLVMVKATEGIQSLIKRWV